MRLGTRCVSAALTVLVLASGCAGTGGSDEERIAREREDAAEDARRDERIRLLERERSRERRDDSGGSGGQSPAPTPTSGRTSCGDGIAVGPNTTCSFARNVRDAYRESGGSSTIEVYSPVTGETYTMSCTAGVTTVCSGGNNATVYFR